jgi:hypothetical protein
MGVTFAHALPILALALADLSAWLMQGVYVGCAVLLVAQGFAILREERAARRWPATQGVISDVRASAGPGGRRLPHPLGDVTYAYGVAGRCYHARRVAFCSFTWGRYRRELEYVATLTPGSRVTVYYDPAHPGRAVLDRRTSAWDYAVFLAAGLAMLALWPFVFPSHPPI